MGTHTAEADARKRAAVSSWPADPITGRRAEAAEAHSRVRWVVLVPVALVVGILAPLVVPFRMVGRWTAREALLAVAAAAAAVVLTGLPPGSVVEPPLPVVSMAAAVAVCALVLPRMSGSFLLLTVGLYAPTLAAVNDRDVAYLGAFALGALVGLGAFVKLLQYLLTEHRDTTLAVMTGLMAGSLRALCPWQDDDRTLLAPGPDLWPVLGLVALGIVTVLVLLRVEHLVTARQREL